MSDDTAAEKACPAEDGDDPRMSLWTAFGSFVHVDHQPVSDWGPCQTGDCEQTFIFSPHENRGHHLDKW
jgi:hypothetical protein